MSTFSRQSYDISAYSDEVKQSTNVLDYNLDPTQQWNCGKCLSVNGPRNKIGNYSFVPKKLVDVDSILSNRTQINTKSISKKTDDYMTVDKMVKDGKYYNRYFGDECSSFLNPEDSRFTHPKNNYKGLMFNIFYKLNKDPQCNVFWDSSLNTRLYARDTYLPEYPRSFDGQDLLPKPLGPKKM